MKPGYMDGTEQSRLQSRISISKVIGQVYGTVQTHTPFPLLFSLLHPLMENKHEGYTVRDKIMNYV